MASEKRRPPDEIAEELTRLQQTPVAERDRLSLVHELSVYHEELVVQNEALKQAPSALEHTRDVFIELYDFSPTGYLTLDDNGLVLQCNLTVSALLGRSRQGIEGFPLVGYVAAEDRARFMVFLRECRQAQNMIEVELAMHAEDRPRTIHLRCRPRSVAGGRREYFTSLEDVSARRALEVERDRVAKEHADLAARLIAAQDDERQRIARNLHDDIGQQHTAIRLTLERLAKDVHDEQLRPLVAELQEMFARLDQRVHFVATELRPSALDLGLSSALEQFVRDWSETFHVSASFVSHLPETMRLTPDVETHLYRIAQEALNNAAKHAAAANVSVVLDTRDGGAVLIIEDDGTGFDVERISADGSPLGLLGMRERAQIVGGRLDVESVPGQGTTIFVHVPPPPENDWRHARGRA